MVISGDLNFSPKFGPMKKTDSGSRKQFELNASLYENFFKKTQSIKCKDSFEVEPNDRNYPYTYNREYNLLVKHQPESSYEPSQRVDHIFLCDPESKVQGFQAGLIFDEAIESPKRSHNLHLSDHFGVRADIQLTP